jgi:hypothetical protein
MKTTVAHEGVRPDGERDNTGTHDGVMAVKPEKTKRAHAYDGANRERKLGDAAVSAGAATKENINSAVVGTGKRKNKQTVVDSDSHGGFF